MREKIVPVKDITRCYISTGESIWACPECNTPLIFKENNGNFCYGCGREIDWNVKIKK